MEQKYTLIITDWADYRAGRNYKDVPIQTLKGMEIIDISSEFIVLKNNQGAWYKLPQDMVIMVKPEEEKQV